VRGPHGERVLCCEAAPPHRQRNTKRMCWLKSVGVGKPDKETGQGTSDASVVNTYCMVSTITKSGPWLSRLPRGARVPMRA
jgi:hypothetical protein